MQAEIYSRKEIVTISLKVNRRADRQRWTWVRTTDGGIDRQLDRQAAEQTGQMDR